MLIEIDKDVYEDIENNFVGGTHKEFDDNWEMHYFVEEVLLDMYEGKVSLIEEQYYE